MNIIKSKLNKICILMILAVLPAIFPVGGRDYFIFSHIPSFVDTADGTFAPWALIFAFIWVTLIWYLYGYFAARWLSRSKKMFFVCNTPIIVNAISEIIYYNVLCFTSEDHPEIAYWIGSHIDKVNPFQHLFGAGPVAFTVTISVLYYFFLFWLAYNIGLQKKNNSQRDE